MTQGLHSEIFGPCFARHIPSGEESKCFVEENTIKKNSSIDNLLATGVLNAGEGAYQFLAHSLRLSII